MVWVTRPKELHVSQPVTGHSAPLLRPHPTHGRAPKGTSFTFTPAGLFGATARCSSLRPLDPLAVTPESEMIRAMIERHVDESSPDFFLLGSVWSLKDFMGSHFAGAVAAGLTYLFMIGEGYVWADHFEHQSPKGDPAVRVGPDFVFAGPRVADVALVESKGTISATPLGIDRRTEDGYVRQIEPHLGHPVGAAIATHGFSVGAWMTPAPSSAPPTGATLVLHHTAPRRALAGVGPATAAAPITEVTSIVAGNYATACDLVFGSGRGQAIRDGRPFDADFDAVDWLGERWIVPRSADDTTGQHSFDSGAPAERWLFALHHETATEVFERSATGTGAAAWTDFRMNPAIERLTAEASGRDSRIFPDGLAVIARTEFLGDVRGPRRPRDGSPSSSDSDRDTAAGPTTNQTRSRTSGEFEA